MYAFCCPPRIRARHSFFWHWLLMAARTEFSMSGVRHQRAPPSHKGIGLDLRPLRCCNAALHAISSHANRLPLMASRLRAPSATDMVPCSYALNLVELVARWGIPPQELLLGSCLAARDLEDPSGRIPLTTMNALVGRARDLTEEPGLGFYLGMQKRVSMYGYLGFAT